MYKVRHGFLLRFYPSFYCLICLMFFFIYLNFSGFVLLTHKNFRISWTERTRNVLLSISPYTSFTFIFLLLKFYNKIYITERML